MSRKREAGENSDGDIPKWLRVVMESVEGVRFGTIQIVVHDGRVTQIDSTRRVRMANDEKGDDSG